MTVIQKPWVLSSFLFQEKSPLHSMKSVYVVNFLSIIKHCTVSSKFDWIENSLKRNVLSFVELCYVCHFLVLFVEMIRLN